MSARRWLRDGVVLFLLALYAGPFFWLLSTRSPAVVSLAIIVGVAVGHNAMYGPQAAYFSELFGSSVAAAA